MKKFIAIFVIVLVSGCLDSPTGNLPSISKDEIAKESERQKRISYAKYMDQMSLVKSMTYKINLANVDICKKVDYATGITYANDDAIGVKIAKFFPSNLNLGSKTTIIDVVENSSADKAGLLVGDKILKLGDYELPEGKKALKKISKHFSKLEQSQEIQRITIDRNGEIKSLEFKKKKTCNYPVILTQDNIVNAFADGKKIIMTQGIVDYAKDDNELALVIAHELAHNDRGHLDAKKKNTLIMGSIGFILDLMTIYYSGGTAGGNAENTEMWSKIGAQAYSVEFEKDADYGGAYYATRAGYDISNANEFWERMGAENPNRIAFNSSHPATAERYLQIKKTVEEINKKKSEGLALIPNEKDSLKKEETKADDSNSNKNKKKKFDIKKLFKKKKE